MSNKSQTVIEIKPIDEVITTVRIQGTSPLIVHAWSAKAKREILEKELGLTKTKAREQKNPLEDFASSMYWLTPMPEVFTEEEIGKALSNGARFGFSVGAIKDAAISAAYRNGWTKDKVSMQGVFYIEADTNGYYAGDLAIDWGKKRIDIVPNQFRSEQMIEIHGDMPVMREDMVRVGMGSADIRYRGQFTNWYMDVNIRYNRNGKYSLEQIINMLNAGGFTCGLGEWRPEKGGSYGMFKVTAI